MSISFKLDETDRKILDILQSDGKITNAGLSKMIGLSPAPTLERVKKLETHGYIKSYHALVDAEKMGLGVTIFVLVSLSSHKLNQIQALTQKIEKIPQIIECHHITGAGDFLMKILVSDIDAYQKLIMNTLSQIEEIGHMQSMVNLGTFKESKVLPSVN